MVFPSKISQSVMGVMGVAKSGSLLEISPAPPLFSAVLTILCPTRLRNLTTAFLCGFDTTGIYEFASSNHAQSLLCFIVGLYSGYISVLGICRIPK
jgi:hypothetical protein